MRIDRLKLKNFRQFADFDQRLNRRFMLFIGQNGTGKTTLLDALSVAFGAFLLGIPPARTRPIGRGEVREDARNYDGTLDFVPMYPVTVEVEGVLMFHEGETELSESWSRSLLSASGRTNSKDAAVIRDYGRHLYKQISDYDDVTLPLLNYYGTGRLWQEPRRRKQEKRPNRFDAYKNSHEARVSSADLLDWIERERFQELETGHPSSRLNAWREAVSHCFDEPVEVNYYPSRKRVEVTFKRRELRVSYENLSHGQRNILSMVGDIAYKSILLNPHLGAEAVRETPGIVLIDEIDLHLHPRWQRMIIPALLKSFPKLQFFATTHSPFVIQSMHKGSVLNLDDGDVDDGVYNMDLLNIIEDIQNVPMPERSEIHRQQFEGATQYLSLVQRAGAAANESVEAELDRLEREIENPGLAAILKMKRLAAQKK